MDSCLYTHALTLSVSLLDILAELWLLVGLNNLLSDCQAKHIHTRFSSVLMCSATAGLAQTQKAHTDGENEQKTLGTRVVNTADARGWANRQNVTDNSTD